MDHSTKSTKSQLTLIPVCLWLLSLNFKVTNGQELNQQSTINDLETTSFLDWFYINELLPYFLIHSNQYQLPSTINHGGLLISPTATTANQLIANIMPHITLPINPMESNLINQRDKIIFPNTIINNSGYQLSQPSPSSTIYFNQNDQSSNRHHQSRVSSRRHFGSPVPGTMTNDNFDKEKTIDETRAEKMNPLIKVNVKIRENIKALKELEATFQKQPVPRRIVSKLLLRAILNPLR
ncbi:uncharacterized protein LOC128386988 isoform X3 [Panonychus citri]|uniref:uncharacterized protein LOC128386988 isoform X3 n=1 Tax=Panonychus citri TaxID=50023 RepID=UPI0023076024|nr:uncharacterized protein LOC128386988 isoform X3 [Panonychus citri]